MAEGQVLIACEYSGRVRDAFRKEGYDAISCDLLPTESPGPHIQDDVRSWLQEPWALVIAHPPCQKLCKLGVTGGGGSFNHERFIETYKAASFFLECFNANSPMVAVENPSMFRQAKYLVGGEPNFAVHPWMFGDGYSKRTCFWTKNLPPLLALGQMIRAPLLVHTRPIHRSDISVGTVRDRERTPVGLATAMAKQWGAFIK